MQTLDGRIRVVWVVRSLVLAGILAGAVFGVGVAVGFERRVPVAVGAFVLTGVLGSVHAVARFRVWRYAVEDHDLYLDRGVLTKVETSVPYVRVQHVDTRRGPVERLLGLASVVVYTAGSRGADVTIPGLTLDRAQSLRTRLRDLAIESEGEDAV